MIRIFGPGLKSRDVTSTALIIENLPVQIVRSVDQDVVHHNTHKLHKKRCMYQIVVIP